MAPRPKKSKPPREPKSVSLHTELKHHSTQHMQLYGGWLDNPPGESGGCADYAEVHLGSDVRLVSEAWLDGILGELTRYRASEQGLLLSLDQLHLMYDSMERRKCMLNERRSEIYKHTLGRALNEQELCYVNMLNAERDNCTTLQAQLRDVQAYREWLATQPTPED